MITDAELLRRYAEQDSEEAFAELVERRIALVYTIALRQVGGDAHLAQDVTQKVFAALARKAGSLIHRPTIGGWLYRATHGKAVDLVRTESRRRVREKSSELMPEPSDNPTVTATWDNLRPMLDEAMSDLSDRDRDAVALRFFEGRAFAEIGRALRLSEEAARKRVERALEKMAAALSRRGVTSTSAALAVALAEQAVGAAPAGLATTVAGTAISGACVMRGWNLLGSLASLKAPAAIAVTALVVGGITGYQLKDTPSNDVRLTSARRANESLRARIGTVQRNLETVQHSLETTEQRAREAEDDNAKLLKAIESARRSRIAKAAAPAAIPDTAADPRKRNTLSVDFPDEDIRNVLRNVADLFELNLAMPDSLRGKTTLKLRDVTWQEIFSAALGPVSYNFVVDGNIIRVQPAAGK